MTKKELTAKQKKNLRDKLRRELKKHEHRIMKAHGIHHRRSRKTTKRR